MFYRTGNSYIGNGQYLLTIDICESISNSTTLNGVATDWATIYGIIITVNGANIVGINTPSITGVTQGTVALASQPFPNQVEYGDWGKQSNETWMREIKNIVQRMEEENLKKSIKYFKNLTKICNLYYGKK